jgi:hypothetical protein
VQMGGHARRLRRLARRRQRSVNVHRLSCRNEAVNCDHDAAAHQKPRHGEGCNENYKFSA